MFNTPCHVGKRTDNSKKQQTWEEVRSWYGYEKAQVSLITARNSTLTSYSNFLFDLQHYKLGHLSDHMIKGC